LKGNGKKARIGLILAIQNPEARNQIEVAAWKEASRGYRRLLGVALERRNSKFKSQTSRKVSAADGMNEAEAMAAMKKAEGAATESQRYLPELKMAKMLRCRVRYFTDGAVIGSREFVNLASAGARERFSRKRNDGARPMRGDAKAAAGVLWSMRALRVGVG